MKMPDVKEASPQVGLMGAGMSFATSSALKDIVNTAGLGDKEQLQVLLPNSTTMSRATHLSLLTLSFNG